jgi:hypothetical protein
MWRLVALAIALIGVQACSGSNHSGIDGGADGAAPPGDGGPERDGSTDGPVGPDLATGDGPSGGRDAGRDGGGDAGDATVRLNCPSTEQIGGGCAGAPTDSLCQGADCAPGDCTTTVNVADDSQLQAALSAASAGTCIVLAPGAYQSADVPAQVRLFGQGGGASTLTGVKLAAGSGMRGLSVEQSGVKVRDGATGVNIDAVTITGAAPASCTDAASCPDGTCLTQTDPVTGMTVGACQIDALDVGTASSVTITSSNISQPSGFGIYACGAASITVERVIVDGSMASGLWLDSTQACASAVATSLTLQQTIVRNNHRFGVALFGIAASVGFVRVSGTQPDPLSFDGGGGVGIWAGSSATGAAMEVLDNKSFGLFVDSANAALGDMGSDQAVTISGNLIGVWIQNAPMVHLKNLQAVSNLGVGVGLNGAATGVLIDGGSLVMGTGMASLPALLPDGTVGMDTLGDGLSWLGGAKATLQGLTLSGNQRTSVLINGEVASGSSINNPVLTGGDEGKGIQYQRVPPAGVLPAVQGATLQQTAQILSVVIGPQVQ